MSKSVSQGTWLVHLMAGVMIAMFLLSGCTRGIKEGIYALKGSSGEYTLLSGNEEKIPLLADEYGGIKVEPFQNDVGAICPPQFLDALPAAIEKQLQYRPRSFTDRVKFKKEDQMPPFFTGPADKLLLIKGKVIQYEPAKKGEKGVMEKVIGNLDEAICRVKLFDSDSGALLGESNCVGRVQSSIRTGNEQLAEGIAKAIRKWLTPKKLNEEEQEDNK